ncbi:pro-MCH [Heptranchias perlo]|uniref:pro-MCH n=1 Tax=Heptranchias perlo TaxID=212740 RepID=UPI003559AA45
MTASACTALFISVLFSIELSISFAKAGGQLEESKVPQNYFDREMLAGVGSLPEKARSSGSFKPYQLLQPDKASQKDLGFKMHPKTIQRPVNSASRRLFKPPLTLHEPMKEPLYFPAKMTGTSQAPNKLEEFETTEARRESHDGENGAIFPVGRRDFDMLRCMLGRVYRPCWQN